MRRFKISTAILGLLATFVPAAAWACGPTCEGAECFLLYGFISLFVTWVGAGVGFVYLVAAHRRTLGWLRTFGYPIVSWIIGAGVLSLTFTVLEEIGNAAHNDWWPIAAFAQSVVVQIALVDYLRRRYVRKQVDY